MEATVVPELFTYFFSSCVFHLPKNIIVSKKACFDTTLRKRK
jgi:hypothetical protein